MDFMVGPPLFMFRTVQLDLRGLYPGKFEVKGSLVRFQCVNEAYYKLYAKRGCKILKAKFPVLHINSAVYTSIALLN